MNENKQGSALSLLWEIITLLVDHIKINLKVFEDNLVRIKEIDTAIQQHTFIDEEGDETYDSVGMELYREKRKLEEINSKTKSLSRLFKLLKDKYSNRTHQVLFADARATAIAREVLKALKSAVKTNNSEKSYWWITLVVQGIGVTQKVFWVAQNANEANAKLAVYSKQLEEQRQFIEGVKMSTYYGMEPQFFVDKGNVNDLVRAFANQGVHHKTCA